MKAKFDALPEDKQSEFCAIFDNPDFMSNKAMLMIWVSESEENAELMGATMEKVRQFCAENE